MLWNPSYAIIQHVIDRKQKVLTHTNKKIGTLAASLITYITALIPIFKSCPPCPVCMPQYAALFSLFGLKLADYSQYLIPIMLIGIGITLSSMYQQISIRQHPFITFYIALLASILLIIGKFIFDSNTLIYTAMLCLFTSTSYHHYKMRQKCCPTSATCNS